MNILEKKDLLYPIRAIHDGNQDSLLIDKHMERLSITFLSAFSLIQKNIQKRVRLFFYFGLWSI